MKKFKRFLVVGSLLLLATQANATVNISPIINYLLSDSVEIPQEEGWTQQWGTSYDDIGQGITSDSSGNVYVTGYTYGALDGNSNSGYMDIFVTKYSPLGEKLWTQQWGTSNGDYGEGITSDSSGNVYVTGTTNDPPEGESNSRYTDIFLTKYSTSGERLWTEQWGTSGYDYGAGITSDGSGNLYISGLTYGALDGNSYSGSGDIFVTKYSPSGEKLWTKQWGTSGYDVGASITSDSSGNVYVTGHTGGTLDGNSNSGSADIFVTKYSPSGEKLWTKQWGTSGYDFGASITSDNSGNVYVTGATGGALDGNSHSGGRDIFVTKYSPSGEKLWTQQWGTSVTDYGYGITSDSSGNLYVTGDTSGALDGNSYSGDGDIFVTKYSSAGEKLWTEQWGTNSYDDGFGITSDSSGNLYITGATGGAFDGNSHSGYMDIFLTKIVQTKEQMNTPPIANAGADQEVMVFDTVVLDGSLSSDVDGDSLSYLWRLLSQPANSSATLFDSNSTQSYFMPDVAGLYTVELSVNDGTVTSVDTITITVSAPDTDGDGVTDDIDEDDDDDGMPDSYEEANGLDSLVDDANDDSDGDGFSNFDEYISGSDPQDVQSVPQGWTKQWGTSDNDVAQGITSDISGNLYITGYTEGAFDGNSQSGDSDIFLTKYSASGEKLWTQQWGTSGVDLGYDITSDSSGNVYVTGSTTGALDGNSNSGFYDIFLTKYSPSGERLWTQQWGTSSDDYGYGITSDSSGNLYVTGYTSGALDGNSNSGSYDIFVTKYSPLGEKLWTKQWGTSSSDRGYGITSDGSGNLYVTGRTGGALDGNSHSGSADIFLTKYSPSGEKLWTQQWGTSNTDYGRGITSDSSGNLYVTGVTRGALDGNSNSGESDIFVTKYSSAGEKLWTQQWGTSGWDSGNSITSDNSGNLYVTGYTGGTLDGNIHSGNNDIFVTKCSASGEKLWTQQWGTSSYDDGFGIISDSSGNLYVTGRTGGALDGNSHNGGYDIFLTKIQVAQENTSIEGNATVGVVYGEADYFDFATGIASDSSVGADFIGVSNEGTNFGNEGASDVIVGNRIVKLADSGEMKDMTIPTWTDSAPWVNVSYDWTDGTGGLPLSVGQIWGVYTDDENYALMQIKALIGGDFGTAFTFDYIYYP